MAQQICFGFVYLAEGLIAWQLFEALLPRKRKLGICVSMYALCYLAAFLMYQTAGQLLNVVAFLLGNVVILVSVNSSNAVDKREQPPRKDGCSLFHVNARLRRKKMERRLQENFLQLSSIMVCALA